MDSLQEGELDEARTAGRVGSESRCVHESFLTPKKYEKICSIALVEAPGMGADRGICLQRRERCKGLCRYNESPGRLCLFGGGGDLHDRRVGR